MLQANQIGESCENDDISTGTCYMCGNQDIPGQQPEYHEMDFCLALLYDFCNRSVIPGKEETE